MAQQTPAVGADVTDLMPVGTDVTDLMGGAPAPKATAAPDQRGVVQQFADQFKANMDPAIGAAKGLGNTVFGLGKVVRDYTPVGRISDAIMPGAFNDRPEALKPSNAAQQLGYTAEQIGEFFIPGGAAGKLGKAAEIAKSGVLTGLQGGGAPEMGIAAGLTAALPAVGGAAARLSRGLRTGAEKAEAQALGATKEWAKSEAAKLAPGMLERGVRGSREAMLEQATAASKEAGKRLGAAYKAAAEAGQTVSGPVIRGELQFAKDGLMVPNATGQMIPIAGAEGVLKKLDKLENFVTQLGDDIPVDHAHKIKTLWDRVVAKAGLYGPKAMANATDQEAAWAIREGAGSFRQLLNDVPDVAALNKEFAFQAGLRDVLKETLKRTQAQGGGLLAGTTSAAGGAAGFASGDDLTDSLTKAFVGAAAGKKFVQLMQSPWWRTTVTAPMKDAMARALASGDKTAAHAVLARMTAALPSQARQLLTQ